MHPYTVKNWLWVVIVLLFLLVSGLANANTMCNFKEQTLLTNDESQQIVSKHRVDTCIDATPPVEYGIAPQCGVPRNIDPRFPSETVACQLDDGSWRQHNIYGAIDQYGKKTELINFPEPDFADYTSRQSMAVLFASIRGWFRSLNKEQQHLHFKAIKNSLEQSSNGQGYRWNSGDAGGVVTVVATFPSSQGHCKILHTLVQSGNSRVADSARACYNNSTEKWFWVTDK